MGNADCLENEDKNVIEGMCFFAFPPIKSKPVHLVFWRVVAIYARIPSGRCTPSVSARCQWGSLVWGRDWRDVLL